MSQPIVPQSASHRTAQAAWCSNAASGTRYGHGQRIATRALMRIGRVGQPITRREAKSNRTEGQR